MLLALAVPRSGSIPSETRRSIEHSGTTGIFFLGAFEQGQNVKITFFLKNVFISCFLFCLKERKRTQT